MLKNNAYHVYIKRLDTDEEIGFILASGERGHSMSVVGADSLAPVTSEGEMQYGDFLNISVFAQSDWSGQQNIHGTAIGPSGVKYWEPEPLYSNLLPTKSYYRSRDLDSTSIPGELSLLGGATLMANFPDPEGTISCWQYYDGKIYVGLSSSPKIYYTDDFGTTWTLLIDLTTDYRSQFSAMEEIVDLWWDTNGAMTATLFFAVKKTDNSAGYMLRYSADKSPLDYVKVTNYAGVPPTIFTDTTISSIAPSTDSGSYTGLGDSASGTYDVCDASGGAISWGGGDSTVYIKVDDDIFINNLDFNIRDTATAWHNRTVTNINNIGGGKNVLTLNSAIAQADFSATENWRIRNEIATATPTKFYVGDVVTVDNGVTSEIHTVIGINDGGWVYFDDGFDEAFGVGAGTFTIARNDRIPVEVNITSPCQGVHVSIDDKVFRVIYAFNGNSYNLSDNEKDATYEWCIHSTGYSTSLMPAGMATSSDSRTYVLLADPSVSGYPSASPGTDLVYEKITSFYCGGNVPTGGRLFSARDFVAITIASNDMTTYYFENMSDYSQFHPSSNTYSDSSNGIGAISTAITQTTTGVKPGKLHQATVSGGLLSTGDIIIASQKVPLAIDSTIYYVDGLTGASTKPFGADLPSSASVKDITQDSSGAIHSIISPEGKHWYSDPSGNHTLVYTLPTFDNGETYPEAIEFWNGSVWYANPFDSTVYEYDIADQTILPSFGLDVTESITLRFPTMLGAGSYLFIESNESQKTFRYDESIIADSGWLESSDYTGLIPAVDKNWHYARVTTKKLLADTTAKIRLQVSFDLGVTWYYLSNTLGTAWLESPGDFSFYESGLIQVASGIDHIFYFPYGSKSRNVMYRINLIKGSSEKPVVTNVSLHYNIIEDKEEIYNYLFILNKRQELTDGSKENDQHLTKLAFLKSVWEDEVACEITHVDKSTFIGIPFKPQQVAGGGININFGGYDAAFRNENDIEYSVGLSFKTIAPFNT